MQLSQCPNQVLAVPNFGSEGRRVAALQWCRENSLVGIRPEKRGNRTSTVLRLARLGVHVSTDYVLGFPIAVRPIPPTSTKLIKTSSRYGHVPGKRPNRKLTTTRNSAPSCYGDEDMAKAGCMIGNGRLLLGVLRFLFVEFEEFGVIDADVFQNLPFWLE